MTKIERKNNFDLLRFVFAMIVVFVHIQNLTKMEEFEFATIFLNSQIAVEGFFIISGFLIIDSYENANTIKEYFFKRIKRIYPAYFFVVVSSGMLLNLLSSAKNEHYFSFDLFRYLVSNLCFLNMIQPSLPGVFGGNPCNSAINGALWTIKIEVVFYMIIPAISYMLKKKKSFLYMLYIYIFSFCYVEILNYISAIEKEEVYCVLGKQLPGQLQYFISGTCLYYYRAYFEKYRRIFLVISLIICFLNLFEIGLFLKAISLSVLIVYVALYTPYISLNKIGDLSYGIYLFHYPIIQGLISLGLFYNFPYGTFCITVLMVLFLARLSWVYIEKPCMNFEIFSERKRKYQCVK